MAKMAKKFTIFTIDFRHFADDLCHNGENGEHFLAIAAIIFRRFSIFAILAINFLAIFSIMAKMAKKFIAIFRHSYYFFPKIDGEMAMSPPPP